MQEGGLHKMKENKQLSLFDIEEGFEDFKIQELPQEEFKKIREDIYLKFYSFSKVKNLIDFLLNLEFEEEFKQWGSLSFILEMTFEDIEEGKEINSFIDIYNSRIKGLETEKEKHERLLKEYRKKFDELFLKYKIKQEEKESFLENIESLNEAEKNLISYKNNLSKLKGNEAEKFESYCKKSINQREEQKKKAETYLKDFTSNKNLSFDIIKEFILLTNEMIQETDSTYFNEAFLEEDYIEALQFIYLGLKNSNEEAIKWNEYFEEGLSIIKNYISLSPEEKEEIEESKLDNFEFIESLEKYQNIISNNDELKSKISYHIQNLRNNLIIDKYGTNKSKPVIMKLFSGQLGKNISSQPEFIEKIDQKKNPSKVEFTLSTIDNNNKAIELPSNYKPVINGLLTYYEQYGTQEAFSLISFYEGYYKAQFHPEEKNSILNLNSIDKIIQELRFLISKIRIKRKNEEGEIINEQEIKLEDLFFPIRRIEVKERTYKIGGKEIQASNNIYYRFTSKPILYEYAELFSNKNLLSYNSDFWLDIPKGTKPKITSQRNILIRDELIKRIILIKQSKGKMKAKIIYKNFFKDYCSIDYENSTKKQKEELRSVINYYFGIFEHNQQIKEPEEFKEKGQIIGITFTY